MSHAEALLAMTPGAVISTFGGNFASNAFARPEATDALPVIIPAYNKEDSSLIWTLGSLARASDVGEQPIQLLIVINGPGDGRLEEVCADFHLEPGTQVLHSPKGKVTALQVGVHELLNNQEYQGPFATTDDDVLIQPDWAQYVTSHMSISDKEAVSGGAIRYYPVPGVSRSVLAVRNLANAVAETKARRGGTVRAHGNNQWFRANSEGKVRSVFQSMDNTIGYGDDAAIVAAMQSGEVGVLPMSLSKEAQVLTAGDRTRSFVDLFRTAVGDGYSRYANDASWQRANSQ